MSRLLRRPVLHCQRSAWRPLPIARLRHDRPVPAPGSPWPVDHEFSTSGHRCLSPHRWCRSTPPVRGWDRDRPADLMARAGPNRPRQDSQSRPLAMDGIDSPLVRLVLRDRLLSEPRDCEACRRARRATTLGPQSPCTRTVREPFAPGVPPRDWSRPSSWPPTLDPSRVRRDLVLFREQDGPFELPGRSRSITWTTAHDESDQIQLVDM